MDAKDFYDIAKQHDFKWNFVASKHDEQRVYAIYKEGLQTITQDDLANETICYGILTLCEYVLYDEDKMISIAIQACCCGNDRELKQLFEKAIEAHDFAFIQEILDEKHTKDAVTMFPNINSFVKATHLIFTKPHVKQEIINLLCLAMKDDELKKVSFATLQTIASPCQLYGILKWMENPSNDMKKVLLHLETLYCVKNYAKRFHAKFGDVPYSKYDENCVLKCNMNFVSAFPDATPEEKETLYEMICAEDKHFVAVGDDFKSKVIMRAFVKHHDFTDRPRQHEYKLKAIALGDFETFKRIEFYYIWKEKQLDEVLQAVLSSKNAKFIFDCAKHVNKDWNTYLGGVEHVMKMKFVKQLYDRAIDLDNYDAVVEMEKICGTMELYNLLGTKKCTVAHIKQRQMNGNSVVVAIHFIAMFCTAVMVLIAMLFALTLLAQKLKPLDVYELKFLCGFAIGFASIFGITYVV